MSPSGRFALRELRGSESLSVYTLRENNLKAMIRQPLTDAWVLEEVFGDHTYDPPPQVSEQLNVRLDSLRIVDLGGHIGLFGLYMLGRFPAARLVSFEPDPSNLRMITGSRAANGFEDRWEVVPAAAGTEEGVMTFVSNHHLSHAEDQPEALPADTLRTMFPFLSRSKLLREERVEVPVRDCFPALQDADLIKIDIEGGEWALLADPRFDGLMATAIVMEAHYASSPVPDVIEHVETRLLDAGYQTVTTGGTAEALFLWAVKRDQAH